MKIYPGSTDQSGRLFQGDPFSISERNVFETFDVGYLARWANIEKKKSNNNDRAASPRPLGNN